MRWSWTVFFAKLTSRKFWVWIVTTAIAYTVLNADGDHVWITPVVIVWGIISFVYLCGEVLIDSIAKAVEKAQVNLNVGGK